jgi:hypothetical protein
MSAKTAEQKPRKQKRALDEGECDFCRDLRSNVRTFRCCGAVSCDVCTQVVACSDCLQERCEECASMCEFLGCERTFCADCEEFCDNCHKTLCLDHMFKIAQPDGTQTSLLFCERCMLAWCRAFVRGVENPTPENKKKTTTEEILKNKHQ